jgi:hypothetical protein
MQQIKREQEYIDEVSHRSPTLYAFTHPHRTISRSIRRFVEPEVEKGLGQRKIQNVHRQT